MIAKGCTVKNAFSIPYKEDEIDVLYITYQQQGDTVLEKELSDCAFGEGFVSVDLSQEDTLAFQSNQSVQIQIRAKLKNGIATKSKVIKTMTDNILKDGVI